MITPPSLPQTKIDFLTAFYKVSDESDPAAVERVRASVCSLSRVLTPASCSTSLSSPRSACFIPQAL